ncbi:MAG: DUF192 domain-containing protein [Desulfurococcales archaeon]|nr:DUF192 domain-containing protein [Desulfurococcales archaeon]
MKSRVFSLIVVLLGFATMIAILGITSGIFSGDKSVGEIQDVESNGTILIIGNYTFSAYIADTVEERECGYYCYTDYEAIVFLWNSTPSTVTFTMKGIDYPILLVLVRNCTVYDVIEMTPGNLYRINNVGPTDFFIELRKPMNIMKGDPIILDNICTRP